MLKITQNEHGFSLIEAIISVAVLSIGIIALFSTQTTGIRGNSKASQVTVMANWGSDDIEKLLAEDYENLIDTDPSPIYQYQYDAEDNIIRTKKYEVTRVITTDSPVENIKTIDITVTDVVKGSQSTFRYYRADEKEM